MTAARINTPQADGEWALRIAGLTVASDDGTQILRGIDLDVRQGEIIAVVGESGSGKSMTALAVLGLLPRTVSVTSGTIEIGGRDVTHASERQMRRIRGKDVGMVMQNPQSSFNPVLRMGGQVAEPLRKAGKARSKLRGEAAAAMSAVGIADAANRLRSYPHEFSGGMRQRAMIAMATISNPGLILADEPTTALDVTVQAQVLQVLQRRARETGAAVVLITHDLGVVAEVADQVAVMYAGRIIERAAVDDQFSRPAHPYTKGLLESLSMSDPTVTRLQAIPGQPPSVANLPTGCAFHPRCFVGAEREVCRLDDPPSRAVGPEHRVACHFPLEE